jgi:hypothetical protein
VTRAPPAVTLGGVLTVLCCHELAPPLRVVPAITGMRSRHMKVRELPLKKASVGQVGRPLLQRWWPRRSVCVSIILQPNRVVEYLRVLQGAVVCRSQQCAVGLMVCTA